MVLAPPFVIQPRRAAGNRRAGSRSRRHSLRAAVRVEDLDLTELQLLDAGLDLGAVADHDPHQLARDDELPRRRVDVGVRRLAQGVGVRGVVVLGQAVRLDLAQRGRPPRRPSPSGRRAASPWRSFASASSAAVTGLSDTAVAQLPHHLGERFLRLVGLHRRHDHPHALAARVDREAERRRTTSACPRAGSC